MTAAELFECGACCDCGCPLPTIEVAAAHAAGDGFACDDWNEANPWHALTRLWSSPIRRSVDLRTVRATS